MKKRMLAVFLTAVMTLSLLAACGNGSGSGNGSGNGNGNGDEDVSSSEPVTVRVTLWDYSNVTYYKNMFDEFEASQDDIKIEIVEHAADEYPTVVQTQLAGQQNYDVVFHKTLADLSGLINQEHVPSLNDYIAATDDFDESVYSGLLDSTTVDGEVYGLPYRKDNYLVYYNKDLFDAAGVDYPTDGMTFDEYLDLAEQMTSGEGNDKVYGAHFHTWPAIVSNHLRRAGGYDPVDPDTYMDLVPYYEQVLAAQEAGTIMDYGSISTSNIHYSGVFYNQQAAMIHIGTWFTNMLLENAEFNWGVATSPNNEGIVNENAVGSVTPVSLGAYGDNLDEAWIVLQYIAGEDSAVILAENGILPAYSSERVNEIYDAMPETNEFAPEGFSKYINIPNYITETPMHPNGAEIDNVHNEEHSLIMTNSIGIEEGLQARVERAEEILAR